VGRFDGQVVWITGGGTGIGKACACEFAREGATVVVSGRRLDRLTACVEELKALGAEALAVPCDVTDEAAMAHATEQVVAAFGGIDVVLANAGYGVTGTIADLTDDAWRRQFDVNVFGLLNTVRVTLPHVVERKGRFGLLGSVAAFIALPKSGAYCASKAAVRSIAENLALELKGTGATSSAIHPGFVESEIAQVDNEGVHKPEREDRRPAKLMWTAEDAARVIVRGMHRRQREVVVTGHAKFAIALGRWFPSLVAWAVGRG
jgi:NAD(P)-dependent dehydrogenase (short-subunit alcohol dehydrogenase family)